MDNIIDGTDITTVLRIVPIGGFIGYVGGRGIQGYPQRHQFTIYLKKILPILIFKKNNNNKSNTFLPQEISGNHHHHFK